MEKRQLGKTDLIITKVGFGAWAIGGSGWEFGWGNQDDKDSVSAIHRALELGINWIDTAAVYGLGHSEVIVANALQQWKDQKPYIFTKCGLEWDKDGKPFRVLKGDSIRKECEQSLERLKTDVIDLYQIHWPPQDNDEEIYEAWETMTKLKEGGKVRWIGVCNFNVQQMKMAESVSPVYSLQPPYSLIRRRIEEDILPYAKEKEMGVIVYSPMQCGLLTGTMSRERINNLPDDDFRKNNSEFKEPKLTRNLLFVEKVKEAAAKHKRHPGEIAIAWTLKHPAVTGAIVGARNPKQVDEVMNAGNIILDEKDINELEKL